MIGTDRFVAAFGATVPGDEEALVAVISNAVKNGFAIVLNHPEQKRPVCILTARDAKAADKEVQDAAFAAGDPKWSLRKHSCGFHHALTVESLGGDPAKVRTKVSAIVRRMTKLHGAIPNIGVEPGRSRMLVVDVDTVEEREAFLADWRDATGGETVPGMTVESPGKVNDGGSWVHKHGGHFWFTIPEGVELPGAEGKLSHNGWVAMWADTQVLVPPSKRAEGPYVLVGQSQEAPSWLVNLILDTTAERERRRRERAARPASDSSNIDEWSRGITWDEILGPDGWEATGLPDRCGCPVWTAPGDHSSPKSATAHDLGCDRYDTGVGHAPLHVWTDNPPSFLRDHYTRTGSRTLTKIQYVAARDHDGNIGLTAVDQGIPGGQEPVSGAGLTFELPEPRTKREEPETGAEAPEPPPFSVAGSPEEETPNTEDDPKERSMAEQIAACFLSSEDLDHIPPPRPLVAGMLDLDSIARVTGKSGHGKSFVMLDMACCIATGQRWHGREVHQGPVVYMVAEGASGIRQRVRAWEERYNDGERIPKEALVFLPDAIQASQPDHWNAWRQAVETVGPVLVVHDTQARITVGMDENSATEMGILVDRLESIRKATGACVLTVHHLGLNGDHGRGSTAVLGALSSELKVERPGNTRGKVTVSIMKQKDQEEGDPMPFLMDPVGSSVVLVPDGWEPDSDPFDAEPAPARMHIDERLFRVLWDGLQPDPQGFTQGQAWAVVSDAATASKSTEDPWSISRGYFYKRVAHLKADGYWLPVIDDKGKESKSRFFLSQQRAVDLGLASA